MDLTALKDQKFESFEDWRRKATRYLTAHPLYDGKDFRAICYDTKGRRCFCGADFQRARDENAFPVRWVWPDQVAELMAKAFEK